MNPDVPHPNPDELSEKVPDKLREPQAPREIELKILNIGTIESFEQRVVAAGGTKEGDRSLLRDTAFKNAEAATTEPTSIQIAGPASEHGRDQRLLWTAGAEVRELTIPDSSVKLEAVLRLLGLTVAEKNQGPFPKREVRLRSEGEATVLTVKEPRQKGATIDDRPEAEVLVGDQRPFQEFLSALGYEPKSYLEKYRTTFQIGPDVTVVIDEYPRVPPYAEVEGPSQERVREVVRLLGFTEADTASMPVSEYLKRSGLSDDEAQNLRFSQESEHG